MQTSTTDFFSALSRRPTDQRRAIALLVSLVSMVAVLGFAPGVLAGRPAIDVAEPPSIAAPSSTEPATTSTTTTEAPDDPGDDRIRTPGPATLVPDPRPGDLRVDPGGDLLPVGFVADPATEVVLDIPYGPDDIHRLDLHLPANATDAPVVVFLHSGGWIGGDRSYVPELVRRHLERGYAIASVEYRLAPEHPFPAPVHDVKRAIRELKVIAATDGRIDGDALVLYGTSAGGHLAAFAAATVGEFEPTGLTTAQATHDSSVAGIVVAVGPTDLVQMYDQDNAWARPMSGAHAGCEPCTVEQLELPSVGNYLHADLPPAYWAYGELDPLVDAELQGRVIADAWARIAGREFSWFDLVDGVDHNLDETTLNERWLEAFMDLVTGA